MSLQDNPEQEFSLSYDQVEEVLANAECEASGAEIQAILCGMLAAGLGRANSSWHITLIELINNGLQFSPEATQVIRQLFHWSAATLEQNAALTPLLLPDDSYPAIDRLQSLIEWSEGFLLGFGIQSEGRILSNAEIDEALVDLTEVSKLMLEADETEETQEALFTLIEHIKVVVQLIYCEVVLKANVDASVQHSTLH